MKKQKRIFIPSKQDQTNVKEWQWSKNKGLYVVYYDNFKIKSDWTLTELLKANHNDGDGLPAIEVH